QKALRVAHRAEVEADVEVVDDQLRRAAADVEHERAGRRLHAAAGQLGFFVAADESRREAVAPFDLAEERLAVLRIADGTRRDGERALGSERFDRPPVVGEHVANARDRNGEEAAARVDALAEPGDARLAMQFSYAAV